MGRPLNLAAGLLKRLWLAAAGGAVSALAMMAAATATAPAGAQTLSDMIQSRSEDRSGKEKMLVEAKELVYNKDDDTVAASGNVQIYFRGKILEADKVIYNRRTKRLYAEGNAKLTEPDGTISYGSRFDLTDDFREGFIDSLVAETKDKTRFTSPRAERAEGDTTVLEKGTYTACAPCAEHPERPPLWQIRAARIIHKNQEQTVYYENATLEFLGIPFAWVPFLSTPDSTVKRRSGVLTPHYVYNTYLGYGVGVPIYWAMAPNFDLTVTPTVLSRQGLLTEAVWRQRMMYGAYDIRAAGIFQMDSSAFAGEHSGDFRGSLQSTGKFSLSDKWKYGWDVSAYTDRYFYNDYKFSSDTIIADFFKESLSTAYLTGQGSRGYFDLRGYYIVGLGPTDLDGQNQTVAPVLDYNKTFDLPKDRFGGIGGEVTVDFNLTNLSQGLATYQALGVPSFASINVCAVYSVGSCLLRGVAGDYDHVSGQLSWRRNFTDATGGLWQPFAFMRLDGLFASPDTTASAPYGNSTISNANQVGLLGSSDSVAEARAMPGIGLEYRFPLVASTSWATHVFEPIAQLVVRPNEAASNRTINEDAQSLVFDDTTLFEWNKFSGYDRVEGGTRLNAGAQYTMNFSSGGYAHALLGQSFQLAGRNSYAIGDLANTGLDSGLQRTSSYYITQFSFAPVTNYTMLTKANFDNDSFDLKRLEVGAMANFGHLTANVLYQRLAAEPDIGFDKRREGLSLTSTYNITDHYSVAGSVAWDLSRYLYDPVLHTTTDRAVPASYSLGLTYNDECTTLSVRYSSGYKYGAGQYTHSDSILATLTLRTLGSIAANQAISSDVTSDGIP